MAGTGTESESQPDGSTSDADDDFEFCILSSGKGAETDMCVADELFSNGKLLPLRPYLAAGSDGPTYVLPPRWEAAASTAGSGPRCDSPTYVLPARSEAAASTAGSGPRSDSRSASSSGSSSGCVSRSQSSNSASSEAPPRRSLSSSLLHAHPSPSPQLRWALPRRSTGSARPPAAWGTLRLGVAGAPDVYPPRLGETNGTAVARGGGSRSARFEQASAAAVDKKIGLGLFGDILGCKCSPDAVEPVRLPAAPAKRSSKKDGVKSGVRRSRILHWLEELTIAKEKK